MMTEKGNTDPGRRPGMPPAAGRPSSIADGRNPACSAPIGQVTAAVEENHDSLASLELALESANAALSIWDLRTGTLALEVRLRLLYGLPPDQPITQERIIACIHPGDRQGVLEKITEGLSPGEGDAWESDYRIVHPELGVRWIRRTARTERDARGVATRSLGISLDITRSKQAELALIASEERFRNLYEGFMDAFVSVDLAGRILECNQSFEVLLGYSREELVGGRIHDLTPGRWHAQDREIFVNQTLARGGSDIYEKEYIRKDGTLVVIEVRACLLRDESGNPCGMWKIIRDITARKESEKAMREWNSELERRVSERTAELSQSEERFRSLAEVTFEGIAISENGILLDGNSQLARIFGYGLPEMIGRPVADFIASQLRAEAGDCLPGEAEGSCDHYGLHKDGTLIPLEVHARMHAWHGRVVRVTALRDVSEAKRISMELEAQRSELEIARSLAMIGEVSAGVVHQVSQPLSAMALNIAAAKERARTDSLGNLGVEEVLCDLETEVGRLSDAVRQLYAMANSNQWNFAPMDLNGLAGEVIRSFTKEAAHRGVTIEAEFDEGIPCLVGNVVLLRQVLLNLFRNAFEACESKPCGERLVRVRTSGVDRHGVELLLSDNGVGIAEDHQKLLFEPLFTTKPEGLGMGLRLAQTIVRIHSGSIGGDNNPDGPGACFRVYLPVQPESFYTKV